MNFLQRSFKYSLYLLAFFYLFVGLPRTLLADFRLLDSIEEFGEKRFIHPTPARLKAGPVIFHPTLRTEITYDDNILLEPFDPREDVIFNVMPGAVIEIPYDTHQLVVGYEADLEFFTKRTRENDQNQNMFALLDLNFPSWYVNVLEQFSETSGRSGTTFTNRIPRYDQSINPKIGYKWKRMTFEAGFLHYLRDFRRQIDDALDFQLTQWTGVVYFDLFARLKALLEYNVGQIAYQDDSTRGATINQMRVGLEGEIMPNLTVSVRAGAQLRDYEVPAKPDFRSWVGSALIDYRMRENLRFDVEFKREPVETEIVGITYLVEHLVRVGFEYDIRPKWTLFGDAKYFKHNYAERIADGARFGFRRDDHVEYDAGLRYLYRQWLEFEARYEHLRRDSNFSVFDYTDNRFILSSSLYY